MTNEEKWKTEIGPYASPEYVKGYLQDCQKGQEEIDILEEKVKSLQNQIDIDFQCLSFSGEERREAEIKVKFLEACRKMDQETIANLISYQERVTDLGY